MFDEYGKVLDKEEFFNGALNCTTWVKNGKSIEAYDGKSYEFYTDIMSKNMCEALSYPAGSYPYDMCEMINIDYERMFELLVLAPINRIVSAMGYNEIDISMSFEEGLW